MNKILTAEEFLKENANDISYEEGQMFAADVTPEMLIHFAKLHVQAALQAAYENSELKELQDSDNNDELKCYIENDMGDAYILDKNFILNAYDLNQIK